MTVPSRYRHQDHVLPPPRGALFQIVNQQKNPAKRKGFRKMTALRRGKGECCSSKKRQRLYCDGLWRSVVANFNIHSSEVFVALSEFQISQGWRGHDSTAFDRHSKMYNQFEINFVAFEVMCRGPHYDQGTPPKVLCCGKQRGTMSLQLIKIISKLMFFLPVPGGTKLTKFSRL